MARHITGNGWPYILRSLSFEQQRNRTTRKKKRSAPKKNTQSGFPLTASLLAGQAFASNPSAGYAAQPPPPPPPTPMRPVMWFLHSSITTETFRALTQLLKPLAFKLRSTHTVVVGSWPVLARAIFIRHEKWKNQRCPCGNVQVARWQPSLNV